MHAIALVLVAVFLGLGWWQFNRATAGNSLSWGYMFQWPLFAAFTFAFWVREIRSASKGMEKTEAQPPLSAGFDLEPRHGGFEHSTELTGDEATDEYNRYLKWLAENPHRRPYEYPG